MQGNQMNNKVILMTSQRRTKETSNKKDGGIIDCK